MWSGSASQRQRVVRAVNKGREDWPGHAGPSRCQHESQRKQSASYQRGASEPGQVLRDRDYGYTSREKPAPLFRNVIVVLLTIRASYIRAFNLVIIYQFQQVRRVPELLPLFSRRFRDRRHQSATRSITTRDRPETSSHTGPWPPSMLEFRWSIVGAIRSCIVFRVLVVENSAGHENFIISSLECVSWV